MNNQQHPNVSKKRTKYWKYGLHDVENRGTDPIKYQDILNGQQTEQSYLIYKEQYSELFGHTVQICEIYRLHKTKHCNAPAYICEYIK